MTKEYIGHWVLGVLCFIIWCWGPYLRIPPAAILLCASIVPGLLGHALAYKPEVPEVPEIKPEIKEPV